MPLPSCHPIKRQRETTTQCTQPPPFDAPRRMMAEDGRVDVCVAVRRGAKKLMCEFVTAPITWTLDELWQHTVETKLPDLVAEPDRTGLFVDNVVLFNTSCVPWGCSHRPPCRGPIDQPSSGLMQIITTNHHSHQGGGACRERFEWGGRGRADGLQRRPRVPGAGPQGGPVPRQPAAAAPREGGGNSPHHAAPHGQHEYEREHV